MVKQNRMHRLLETISDKIDDPFERSQVTPPLPLYDVVDGCALPKAFKNDRNRKAGIAEHPSAVHPLRSDSTDRTWRLVHHTPTLDHAYFRVG